MTSRPFRVPAPLIGLALFSVALAPSPQAQTQAAPPAEAQRPKMATYYLVLLNKGPSRPTSPTPQDADIQKQHLAHLEKLAADGFGMAAGPMGDDGDLRGLVVMKTASAQQARELAEMDPAVKAGRLAVEVVAFLSPEGWFGKPAQPFSMEQLYFGFLTRGAQTAQDPDSAKRLQKEHIAYMEARHGEGKLVMAGPVLEGGDRRGLVVYRLGSLEEARRIAAGDPMVQAGRLAVELHPWYLARGVLK